MKGEEMFKREIYKETMDRVRTPQQVRKRILDIDPDSSWQEKGSLQEAGIRKEKDGRQKVCGQRTAGRRRRMSMGLAACLLVVLVSGTALAISAGDGLKTWFEMSWKAWNGQEMPDEQIAVIDSLTTPLGVSQTVGDVTVTADSIAYSDGYYWILVHAEGLEFDTHHAYGFAESRLEVESETMDSLGWNWGSEDHTEKSGDYSRTCILIDGEINPDLLEQAEGQDVTFTLTMSDFMENPTDADGKKLLQEGTWTLEFTVPLTEDEKALVIEDFDTLLTAPGGGSVPVRVQDIRVNTVGISYTLCSPHFEDGDEENIHGVSPRAIMKNGGELGIIGGSGKRLEDGSWQIRYNWSMPLDVREIAAVRLGSVTAEMEKAEQ